jgi:hypothetical protein
LINLEYHKGQPCVYSPVFCQEGYCSECAIYAKHYFTVELNDEEVKKSDTTQVREKEILTASRS